MAKRRNDGSGGEANFARALPAVFLPLLVWALHPVGGFASLPLVLLAAAFGVVITVAVPHLRFSLIVMIVVAGLLLSVVYLQELQVAEPPHEEASAQLRGGGSGSDRDEEQGFLGSPYAPPRGPPAAKPRPVPESAVVPTARRDSAEKIHALKERPLQGGAMTAGLAPTSLETMSVVLPCAMEGNFAVKTVEAVWKRTKQSRIKEIIVVDDGSRPPLRSIFPQEMLAGAPGQPPVRILRHERTLGLISAKKTGGDAALGDVIVFFDCHISPREGWEEAFFRQMKRKGDHRTVVVPTITSLNPDTWEELQHGASGKACYILWNSDFTWLANPGRDVPLMSGGLLALSRRWWQELEGYDEHMVAWGGENIDQSLRIWLCGGRIEVAEGAYVAHMWRDPKNPKTQLKYPIPTKDVMRNKARASTAWFGPFIEKVFTFPEYEAFTKRHESLGPFDNFDRLKNKLQCAPFTAYLQRFSYVYFDSGLLPEEVFQLREASSGLCLERTHKDKGQPHPVVLAPCSGGPGGGPAAELQLFHRANRDRSRPGKPCCSGIMNWNFLQCLDGTAIGAQVRTFECQINGEAPNQQFALDSVEGGPMQLFWRHGAAARRGAHPRGNRDAEGCVAPTMTWLADAKLAAPSDCEAKVVHAEAPPSSGLSLFGGSNKDPGFRLRAPVPDSTDGREMCASAVGAEGADSASGFKLVYVPCDDEDPQQVFHTTKMLGGLQVQIGGFCLDTAGGRQLLVYPCYEASVQNMNQIWQIRDSILVWQSRGGDVEFGVSFIAVPSHGGGAPGGLTLQTCAPKAGQVFIKEDERGEGKDRSFLLREKASGQCLGHNKVAGVSLGLGACAENQRWRSILHTEQVQHVASTMCIDAGRADGPVNLYQCHRPQAGKPQRFEVVDEPGWIRMMQSWGDNGRKRWFEKCLDSRPVTPVGVSVQECARARRRGISWEKHNAHIPIERSLWDNSEKAPPGAPSLGGDAAPP